MRRALPALRPLACTDATSVVSLDDTDRVPPDAVAPRADRPGGAALDVGAPSPQDASPSDGWAFDRVMTTVDAATPDTIAGVGPDGPGGALAVDE